MSTENILSSEKNSLMKCRVSTDYGSIFNGSEKGTNAYRRSSSEEIDEIHNEHTNLPFCSQSTQSEKDYAYCTETFTVEDAVESLGFGWFQIKLSLLAGLSWVQYILFDNGIVHYALQMADGMEMSIINVLSPALRCEWNLESWQQAMISTVVFGSMFISSFAWGKLSDKYGRKKNLTLSVAITACFGALSGTAPTFIWLLVLRGWVGVGIGGLFQSITIYSEFLPSKQRAGCILLMQIFWAVGTGAEVTLALVVMPTLGWRWLLVFSSFPLICFVLCSPWLPESARYQVPHSSHRHWEKSAHWKVASGQMAAATATLTRMAKENGRTMPKGRLVALRQSTPHSSDNSSYLFAPSMRRTTLLLLFIWPAVLFSYYGIGIFTTELFESRTASPGGVPANTSHASPESRVDCPGLTGTDYVDILITTAAELPGIILTAILIERLGRKRTIALELGVFASFVFLLFVRLDRSAMTVTLFVARAAIAGALQATYVYTSEVFPTNIRALGLGSCSSAGRLGCTFSPFVAQVGMSTSVAIPICVYGVTCVLGIIATLLLPIETKGRAMKE